MASIYTITAHDARIRAMHDRGLDPVRIAVLMGDVLVGFAPPTAGFVKARVLAMGLVPNRANGKPTGRGILARWGEQPAA